MAKLTINMPDDFMNKVSRLADMTDNVIDQALEAAGNIALGHVRGNLSGVLSGESTGELMGSLGVTPVKLDNVGSANVKVGFNEPRRVQNKAKGKRSYKTRTNAMIANVLEHGKHNQPPRPFMAPARAASEGPCIAAMESKFEEAVSSL